MRKTQRYGPERRMRRAGWDVRGGGQAGRLGSGKVEGWAEALPPICALPGSPRTKLCFSIMSTVCEELLVIAKGSFAFSLQGLSPGSTPFMAGGSVGLW